MSRGILLFAHNSREIDYLQMAIASGGLAKKNLSLPVSLITDTATVEWAKESNRWTTCLELFEHIKVVDRPDTTNKRRLHDGEEAVSVPFINSNRTLAWELTPYDQTLLIDTDYFVFTDNLNSYWDIEGDVKISSAINDIYTGNRLGYLDVNVADTGVHLYWATTIMFNKNENSKLFFDLVDTVREKYQLFSDLYRFDVSQYRNDVAFSVAKHIYDGYRTDLTGSLPPVLSAIDKDMLVKVNNDKLTFLIQEPGADCIATSIDGMDIHIMNKQSITRNIEKLMELI